MKKILAYLCVAAMLSAMLCMTGCQKKQPVKKPAKETEAPPIVYEDLLPNVPDGYSYHEMPKAYEEACSQQGTLELLTYTSLDSNGQDVEDHAYVYLPYGYDQNDTSKKYNVFYMSHGGGGNYYSMFFDKIEFNIGNVVPTFFQNVLDNMIANGDIEPMIVVTPTFTLSSVEYYQKNCFVQRLIPAVEGKYNTYAATTDEVGIKASRDHRAFGGYSMGSCNTWYCFQYNLDYVKWFMPMSGVHWGVATDLSKAGEVATKLETAVHDKGYTSRDFFISTSAGGQGLDNAYEHVGTFFVELSKHTDTFVYTNDFHTGNIHVDFAANNVHFDVPFGIYYIYNTLPRFFQEY